jgi:hypothetical protein
MRLCPLNDPLRNKDSVDIHLPGIKQDSRRDSGILENRGLLSADGL